MKTSLKTTNTFFLLIFLFYLTVDIVSAQVGQVVHSIPSPADRPTGLTWDGQYLWVADIGTNQIYKLDPADGKVVLSFQGPINATINGLTWDGRHLWCSDNGDNNIIYKLDADSGKVVHNFKAPTGSPRGIAFDGKDLWYQDSATNFLYKIDTLSGSILQSFKAPAGNNRGLVWDGKQLWSSDKEYDELYQIDTMHQSIIQILPSPGTYPYGLAFDGKYIWSADYETDTIYKLSVTGTEQYLLLDSLKVDIRYTVTITNVGNSSMDLFTYLACPRNLAYQHLDDSLHYEPEPNYFHTDKYKQKMAVFNDKLSAGQSKTYRYTVPVTLLTIHYLFDPDSCGTVDEIPWEIISLYTRDDDMYQITDPIIVSAVEEAMGEETNYYWKVRRIYKYVYNHIEYLNDSSWDPAPVVLKNGTGSCSEYTFTFVSMCRAAGIPARYEAGGHLRDDLPYDDTIFHRWAQVYFPKFGWVPIDPDLGDRIFPANQARYFGGRRNDLFCTTISGGGEPGLSWSYNVYNSSSGGERQRDRVMQWLPYMTDIGDEPLHSPIRYLTVFNYPNPFNNSTRIVYTVSQPTDVRITIYNALGQRIRVFDEGFVTKGHSVVWDGKSNAGVEVGSGTYYYKISAGEQVINGKMHLIK